MGNYNKGFAKENKRPIIRCIIIYITVGYYLPIFYNRVRSASRMTRTRKMYNNKERRYSESTAAAVLFLKLCPKQVNNRSVPTANC